MATTTAATAATRPAYNPHLPCDYQGGHRWSDPVRGEDTNGNKLTLVICANCGKVRA